jgi:diamine N-acetyltransferase
MIVQSKNGSKVLLKELNMSDLEPLIEYFAKLGPDTIRRYGPHSFERDAIYALYGHSQNTLGYIAIDTETNQVIAYSVIRIGYLEHDADRLRSYGLQLDPSTDCTYAPSVADEWQSQGIGYAMFRFIMNDILMKGIRRIILWGGVQSDNVKAVRFYEGIGFRKLGEFQYNGLNNDMILETGL